MSLDGKKHLKVFLDPLDKEKIEGKLDAVSQIYQKLTTHKVYFEYAKPTTFQKKKLEAQLAFYRQKTQSPVEAKVDVAFMCNSNRGERAGMVLTNDHFNRTD